jgi:uncharacterized membrane protein
MSNESRYGLLSETSGMDVTRNPERERHLPPSAALGWLAAGSRDFLAHPGLSLAYGLAVFAVSALCIWLLVSYGLDYIIFPALAGFMIVAPVLAVGLYQKSRDLEDGQRPTMRRMVAVQPRSGAQIFFTGLLLSLLMLVWMRAAVLLYALFFGVGEFPGMDRIVGILFTTPTGLSLLVVGTLVGGLFAAFGFAVSVFSIPRLLDERTDAFTAMASSMAMVWNNLVPMIAWGAIVLVLFVASVATGLLGLIVVFPLLGHATWHAYKAMR